MVSERSFFQIIPKTAVLEASGTGAPETLIKFRGKLSRKFAFADNRARGGKPGPAQWGRDFLMRRKQSYLNRRRMAALLIHSYRKKDRWEVSPIKLTPSLC